MFQLRRGYEVDVTAAFADNLGNEAAVDGVPVWVVGDPALFTLVVAPDGYSAVVQGTGDTIGGTTPLTLTADADLGEGVVHVTRSEDLQLVSGTATAATFGFGEPRPIEA